MEGSLLTFEFDDARYVLAIHGNEAGLRSLQQAISRLVDSTESGHFSHEHLKTPAWGGSELTEESQGGSLIHHVKMFCWKGSTPQQ